MSHIRLDSDSGVWDEVSSTIDQVDIDSDSTINNKTNPSFIIDFDDEISMCSSATDFNSIAKRDGKNGIFMTESSSSLPTFDNKSKSKDSVDGNGGNNYTISGSNSNDPTALSGGSSRLSLIHVETLKKLRKERWFHILSQVGPPFLIAGLGMVGAGLLLDMVMNWPVFKTVSELVILVTPLLGLKGNLEMTLASRLSTHCNIGNMDIPGNKWRICGGNLVLDQLQAIVCGLAASVIAMLLGLAFSGEMHWDHLSLVIAASLLTASMVSLILGSTMVSVILLSKRFNVNPDNVATPVAGSLGDVVTLGMLSCIARFLFHEMNEGRLWLPYIIISIYAVILPICFVVTWRNEFTKPVVMYGWVPLIVSVAISTGGGLLLDLADSRYTGVALYQPVINGIGGNIVSVQASRISTQLHGECEKKVLPDNGPVCESPITVFFSKNVNSMSARLLLILAVPGHLIFSTVTHFVSTSGDSKYGPLFLALYISAAVIQISVLLYIAKVLTNLCWRCSLDPDTATIPYLTALGDLIGSALLFAAFEVMKQSEALS